MSTKPNWDLLRRTADHIEALGYAHFDMASFGRAGECGCVAFHAIWTARGSAPEPVDSKVEAKRRHDEAAGVLQLPENESYHLFCLINSEMQVEDVNENTPHVPAALRYMADNHTLDWDKAALAVGFEGPRIERLRRARAAA